jgi:hypothetical protein
MSCRTKKSFFRTFKFSSQNFLYFCIHEKYGGELSGGETPWRRTAGGERPAANGRRRTAGGETSRTAQILLQMGYSDKK